MNRIVSWTVKMEGGIKREVRVGITRGALKWQFKRSDQERWDYDSEPSVEDWDILEDMLARRVQRGRGLNMLEAVRKHRKAAGV